MKKSIKLLGIIVLSAVLGSSLTSCNRIDAGHEGIKVKLYGSNKGVSDISLVTGWVWYNPFTTKVFEYPTFVQNIDYNPFTINAKDGSEFTVDPTIAMKIEDGKTPVVFRKYRRKLDDIIHGVLYNYVKDAFRIQLNKFTTDEIVSNRDSIERAIEKQLSREMAKENFVLEHLTSGLKYPKTIVQAVNEKNKAEQLAKKAENELKIAEAEAKKLIVSAQAEKEANELRRQSLSPLLLQQQWIKKWDGKVPIYSGNGSNVFLDISKLK